MWTNEVASSLLEAGVRVATSWDVAAVQRLIVGGWRAEPPRVWAQLHALDEESLPRVRDPGLFDDPDLSDPDAALSPDGHLRPEWVAGGWGLTPDRLARWARCAFDAAGLQDTALATIVPAQRAGRTARAESTIELLCAEMSQDGLPVDREIAESIIATFIGPRPRDEADIERRRAARDAEVHRQAPSGPEVDLRSPGQVRVLLRRAGLDLPDTRASRLESVQDAHPVVPALLAWRKAERVATTYGYRWLDEHLGGDGRLRGTWTGADGAAGRMTASSGLHNMPADLRPAVVAEPGNVFVRADLGQIEPRVLAAVSGDAALTKAAREDDLYAPIAAQLGVERAVAKVAVLGAMYGQTTGRGADALRRLETAYPVAMGYLERAARSGRSGIDLRTYGGRRIAFGGSPSARDAPDADDQRRAAAQGRYARNALVQGAAAELFKFWAVTVRARALPLGAQVVLCLHDELLVQVEAIRGDEVAALLLDCLEEAAYRWAPDAGVRFTADVAVVPRWSDAKS
jgi:DNA polymerase-1